MQPSGGPSPASPLPPSPLPPSPYQQLFANQPGAVPSEQVGAAASSAQPKPRKKGPNPGAIVFVIIVVMAVLVFSGAFEFLNSPSGASNQPSVKVTNTSASHMCPISGTPTETFLFTLVNSGSVHARASIGFYLNDAQVAGNTYDAPVGSSTPYSVTAPLGSCPPSGSTYYLSILSVVAA